MNQTADETFTSACVGKLQVSVIGMDPHFTTPDSASIAEESSHLGGDEGALRAHKNKLVRPIQKPIDAWH